MLNVKNGFTPILCIRICITIDTVLNFDGDFDVDAIANVKHEQGSYDFSHTELMFSVEIVIFFHIEHLR